MSPMDSRTPSVQRHGGSEVGTDLHESQLFTVPELAFLEGVCGVSTSRSFFEIVGPGVSAIDDEMVLDGGRVLAKRQFLTAEPQGFDLSPFAAIVARVLSSPQQVLSIGLLDHSVGQLLLVVVGDDYSLTLRPIGPAIVSITVMVGGVPAFIAEVARSWLSPASARAMAVTVDFDRRQNDERRLFAGYEPDGSLMLSGTGSASIPSGSASLSETVMKFARLVEKRAPIEPAPHTRGRP